MLDPIHTTPVKTYDYNLCAAIWLALLFTLLFTSCNQEKNEATETQITEIKRSQGDRLFTSKQLYKAAPPSYPWDQHLSSIPKITQEYFRCQGCVAHPPKEQINALGEAEPLYDCDGSHGLPLHEDREYITPILIELLNYLQEEFQAPVIITCGHRCPKHNRYADPTKSAATSKHQVGAEVDFYLVGMEHEPMQVIEKLFAYYEINYPEQSNWNTFSRYPLEKTDVSIEPWFNREVYIKLYQADEGRDFDQQHPYPYICIQARYDKTFDSAVQYTWPKAHRGYWRTKS